MYTSVIVLLSLIMHKHRPSNCTNILPVLDGCGPLRVVMLTAVVGFAVVTAVAGVAGVALLGTVAGTIRNIEKKA